MYFAMIRAISLLLVFIPCMFARVLSHLFQRELVWVLLFLLLASPAMAVDEQSDPSGEASAGRGTLPLVSALVAGALQGVLHHDEREDEEGGGASLEDERGNPPSEEPSPHHDEREDEEGGGASLEDERGNPPSEEPSQVKRKYVPKPPKTRKGRLQRRKKLRYPIAQAKESLGLPPTANFQQVYAAAASSNAPPTATCTDQPELLSSPKKTVKRDNQRLKAKVKSLTKKRYREIAEQKN